MKLKSSGKRWIGFGLLALMLVKACVIPLICLDYEIRKDYIAKTLCVNRNKPMLKCNGKCYLAKKLVQAEKQQQRQAEQDYMSSLIHQVMDATDSYSFSTPAMTAEAYLTPGFSYKTVFLGRIVSDNVFHPPLV